MSTLPPQPVRRPYIRDTYKDSFDTDYGTDDFSSPTFSHKAETTHVVPEAPALKDVVRTQTQSIVSTVPGVVSGIVSNYQAQGKKDSLLSTILSGSGLVTLLTGLFGPWLLALPLVLAILGLVWGQKARKNGVSATAGIVMGWIVLGVSIIAIILGTLTILGIGAAMAFFG